MLDLVQNIALNSSLSEEPSTLIDTPGLEIPSYIEKHRCISSDEKYFISIDIHIVATLAACVSNYTQASCSYSLGHKSFAVDGITQIRMQCIGGHLATLQACFCLRPISRKGVAMATENWSSRVIEGTDVRLHSRHNTYSRSSWCEFLVITT